MKGDEIEEFVVKVRIGDLKAEEDYLLVHTSENDLVSGADAHWI